MNGSIAPALSLADAARLASAAVAADLAAAIGLAPPLPLPFQVPVPPPPPPAPWPIPGDPRPAATVTGGAPVQAPPTPHAFEPPPTFQILAPDFALYHPDHCDGRSAYGILVDALPILFKRHHVDTNVMVPAIYGLVMILIEETLVLDFSGKRPVIAKPGQEIMIGADHLKLARLVRAALDPKGVGEIWMRPDRDVRVAYGPDDYRSWDVRHGQMFPREQIKRAAR